MRRLVLYLVLVAALPVAILAAALPANSYKAQGIAALDCDGPISVFIIALPALLIYGAGTMAAGAFIASQHFAACFSLLPSAGMSPPPCGNPMAMPPLRLAPDTAASFPLICKILIKPTAFACALFAGMERFAPGVPLRDMGGPDMVSNRRER
jgi:hypothetical protein